MKNPTLILIVVFAICFNSGLKAQEFSISHAPTIDTFLAYPDSFETFNVFFPNLTSSQLILEYDTYDQYTPLGWQVLFCDYTLCQSSVPTHRIMDTVPVGGSGTFRFDINGHNILGCAYYSFKLYNHTGPQIDTIRFIICSPLAISEPVVTHPRIFPSLIHETLFIKEYETLKTIRILNLNGELSLETNAASSIVVADLPPGMYFVLADGKAIGKFVK